MAPTLVASYFVESVKTGSGDSNALTTTSFTPSNGEVLVIKSQTWDKGTATGAISGGGQTYTTRATASGGSFNTYGRIDTAVISGSPGSMTVTSAAPASSCVHSMVVERWSGAQLAATPATHTANATSDGAPSDTIVTAANNSIVSFLCGDSQSRSPTGRAYRSSATEDGICDASAGVNSVQYYAYQSAATAGSQTYGMTTPSNQRWQLAAIEVQAASGTDATATPSAVAAVASVPSSAESTGSTIASVVVAAVTVLGAVSLSTGVTASPAAVSAVTAFPAASVSVGSAVTASSVAAVAGVGAASLSTGTEVAASPVSATAAFPGPTVTTSGNASVTPTTVGVITAIPAANLSVGVELFATSVSALAALPATGVSTGSTVTPAPVAGTATLPASSLSVGVEVSPSTVTATTSTGAVSPVTGAIPDVLDGTIALSGGYSGTVAVSNRYAGTIDAANRLSGTIVLT